MLILQRRKVRQRKAQSVPQCLRGRAGGSDCLDSYLDFAIYYVSVSKLLIISAPQFHICKMGLMIVPSSEGSVRT